MSSNYSTDDHGPGNTTGNDTRFIEESDNYGRESSHSVGSSGTDMKSQKGRGKRKESKNSLTAERRLSAERRLQGAHLRRVKSNRLFEELRAILPDASKYPENATQTSILGEAIAFIGHMNANLKGTDTQCTDWCSIVANNTQELWLVLVPSGRIVYASPYSETILGRPGWPLSSSNLLELVHQTSRDEVQELINECLEPSQSDSVSVGGRQACTAHVLWSQDVRAVELVAQPVHPEHTGDTVYVLVRALPLFPAPSDDSQLGETDGSMLLTKVDMAGHIVYSTGSCMDFMGVPKEALLSMCSFEFVHPDDLPRLADIHTRAVAALKGNQLDVRLGPLCYRMHNQRTNTHGWVMSEWAVERRLVRGLQQDRLVGWTWRAHPVPPDKSGIPETPPFSLACFQEFLLAQQENLQLKQHLRDVIEAPNGLPQPLPKIHQPITSPGPPKSLSGPPSFTDSTRGPTAPLANRPQPHMHGHNSAIPRPYGAHMPSEPPNHMLVAPDSAPGTPRPIPETMSKGRLPAPVGTNPPGDVYPLEYRTPGPRPSGLPMPLRDRPAPMNNGAHYYPDDYGSPYPYQNSRQKTPSVHHLPRSGTPNHQMHYPRSHPQPPVTPGPLPPRVPVPSPRPQAHYRYPPDPAHQGEPPGPVRGDYMAPREPAGYREKPDDRYNGHQRDHRYDPYRRPPLPARTPPPPISQTEMNPHQNAYSVPSQPHLRPDNVGQSSREPSPRNVSGWEAAGRRRRYNAVSQELDRYPTAPGRNYNGMDEASIGQGPPHAISKAAGHYPPGEAGGAGYHQGYLNAGGQWQQAQPGEVDMRCSVRQQSRDGYVHHPGT